MHSLLVEPAACLEQHKLQLRSARGVSAVRVLYQKHDLNVSTVRTNLSAHSIIMSGRHVCADENILVDLRITRLPRNFFLLQEMAPCFSFVKCGGFV